MPPIHPKRPTQSLSPSPKIPLVSISPFRQHVERWQACTACVLHETRQRVVLYRGSVPCDILFTGEAPGESENVVGVPFVGPAGKLLDHIVSRSISVGLTWGMTNIVCCIPRDTEKGSKLAQPEDESVEACKPRLIEIAEICHPRLIVAVGQMARDWLEPGWKKSVKIDRNIPRIDIIHPAAILRANIAQQGLLIQRAIVKIKTAIEDFLTPKEKV